MKKVIFLICSLFLFFQSTLFGQEIEVERLRNDECINRNLSFITIDESNPLFEYVENVESKGIIEFRPFAVEDIGGWDVFFDAISSDPYTTFEYKGMTKSHLFDGYYHRFTQLYQGVPVTGGGFSLFTNIDDPEIFRRPNFPTDPCRDKLLRMSLNIYEDINVDVSPVIAKNSVVNQLPGQITQAEESELKIMNNRMGDCEYQLIWQTKYKNDHGESVGWVDAYSGEFIYEAHLHHYHNKPFFGFPLLNDTNEEDLDVLSNAEFGLSVYDMSGVETYISPPPFNSTFPVQEVGDLSDSFSDDQIPTSPHSQPQWTTADAIAETFFAFDLGINLLRNLRDNLGITFENVNIGVHPTAGGSGIYYTPTLNNPDREGHWIGLGVTDNGNSAVQNSIMGHELGHAILVDEGTIGDVGIEALSLHEGISDMFGIYLGGGNTWIQAERNYNASATLITNCFTNGSIQNTTSEHQRGMLLGHWFYFCVNGETSNSILPMNINEVIELVYEALPNMADSPDFPDLMEATVDLARLKYGRCSDQFATIVRAWDRVCIPTGEAVVNPAADCVDLIVESSEYPSNHVCEENYDGGLFFNVRLTDQSGLNFDDGTWYIEGRNSSLFGSVRGMTGNRQDGGYDLRINYMPEMNYYPQNLRISYRHPQLPRRISTIIKILDCDGDDPTCEEFYDPSAGKNDKENDNLGEIDVLPENFKLIIYDILGNKVRIDEFEHGSIPPGILIYSYWDENGKFLKSEKVVKY